MEKKLIYKQRDLKDCGICCLASIIAYYDGFIPMERLREETHTDQSGVSAFHLVKVAQKYGFQATGIKNVSLTNPNLVLPAIAHVTLENGLNHYVVIYEIKRTKVIIMDPAVGKKTLTHDEFNKIWNNILITLYPEVPILKLDNVSYLQKLIKEQISSNLSLYLSVILCSAIYTFAAIFSSYFIEFGIKIINTHSINNLYRLIITFGIISTAKICIIRVKGYYENYLNKNIDTAIYNRFITHTLNLPLKSLKTRTSGEITSRLNDLELVKNLITNITVTITLDVFLGLTSALLLYRINSSLFFVLCIELVIYTITSIIFNKNTYKVAVNLIDEETNLNAEILESVEGIESIKNSCSNQKIYQKLLTQFTKYLHSSFQFTKHFHNQASIQEFISEIGIFAITSYAFVLISYSKLSLENFITFNALVGYLFSSLKNAINLMPQYNYIKASLTRLDEYLSIKEENLQKSEEPFYNGDIIFQNISYSPNDYNLVLDKLSFKINSGSKIQLIGKSGSGKSTICKLLMRHIEQKSGNILIGGVNIHDYKLDTIRQNIAYVSQNESLFSDTIYNNLTLFQDRELKEVTDILSLCELTSVIDSKPLRLNTMLSQDTSNLSGGEQQRLILARTLLLNKQILILDESLSEVSIDQEERIIKRIIEAYPNKTMIYISHRNLNGIFDKQININA